MPPEPLRAAATEEERFLAATRRAGRWEETHPWNLGVRPPKDERGAPSGAPLRTCPSSNVAYLTFFETSLVMSNIDTCDLPPKTTLSLSSALIIRRFFLSWRPFFLM